MILDRSYLGNKRTDRFEDEFVVFIFQPFFRKSIGDGDCNDPIIVINNSGVFKPCREVRPRYSYLYIGERVVPQFFISHNMTIQLLLIIPLTLMLIDCV